MTVPVPAPRPPEVANGLEVRTPEESWLRVTSGLIRRYLMSVLDYWRVPAPPPVQPGPRYLVTDPDGSFLSIVSEAMAEELSGESGSPDLVVRKLPLDEPYTGAVPYPLTAETAALLLGARK